MAIPAQYQYKIAPGWNATGSLVNVETILDSDGRYFYAPVLVNDYILRQPLSGGGMFAGSLTNNVTFQTQRTIDNGAYSIWNGKLTLPQMSDFQRNYKQYQNMQWQFTRCVQIG
jgi:hypothetical protein